MIFDFLIGVIFGIVGTLGAVPRPKFKDAETQVVERATSPPVAVPSRRPFVPGELVNFWGKDS